MWSHPGIARRLENADRGALAHGRVGPPGELGQRLRQIAAASREEGGPRIFLRADKGLDYGHVMRVMGEINVAGLRKVALVSTQEGAR